MYSPDANASLSICRRSCSRSNAVASSGRSSRNSPIAACRSGAERLRNPGACSPKKASRSTVTSSHGGLPTTASKPSRPSEKTRGNSRGQCRKRCSAATRFASLTSARVSAPVVPAITSGPDTSAATLAPTTPKPSAVHRSKSRRSPAVAVAVSASAARLASTSDGVRSSIAATRPAAADASSNAERSDCSSNVPSRTTLDAAATPINALPTTTLRPKYASDSPGTNEASHSDRVAISAPIGLTSAPYTQCFSSSRRSSAASVTSVPGRACERSASMDVRICGRQVSARKATVRSASKSVTSTRKCALPHAGSSTAKSRSCAAAAAGSSCAMRRTSSRCRSNAGSTA